MLNKNPVPSPYGNQKYDKKLDQGILFEYSKRWPRLVKVHVLGSVARVNKAVSE